MSWPATTYSSGTGFADLMTLPMDISGGDGAKNTFVPLAHFHGHGEAGDLGDYSSAAFTTPALQGAEGQLAGLTDGKDPGWLMQLLNIIMQMLNMITQLFATNDEADDNPFFLSTPTIPASTSSSAGPGGGSSGDGPTNATFRDQGPLAPADPRSNPRMQELDRVAERNARANGTTEWCLREVNDSMDMCGYNIPRLDSAYMEADLLAKDARFQEVAPPSDLRKLPAGAIVVWDRGPDHPDGHISVALGDGREASDHVQDQFTNYGTRCRVFYPL